MTSTWMRRHLVQLVVTLLAAALIAAHLIWPKANIDAVTLGLLAFAVLPWLRGILKGVKLPGGLEITLADAEKVSEALIPPVTVIGLAAEGEEPTIPAIQPEPLAKQSDPNLALVTLRIEVERRLRALAAAAGFENERASPRELVSQLYRRSVFPSDIARGLHTLLQWGSSAAHGATVDKGISEWVATSGNEILAALDALLRD